MEHIVGGGGGKTRFLTPASLMKTTFVYFAYRRSVTDSWPSSKRRCSLLAKTRHIGIFLNNGEERDSLVFLALCKQGGGCFSKTPVATSFALFHEISLFFTSFDCFWN
ncbi:hypothetical protein CEXT_350381 [Caerostris extrusa]|uniref:Uncharacterized protein n=1 Tax=Caerostris extrusa TaxID=172846 RepID=A0AAV4Y3Y4_CAEEX|nr:hypothetical protein CEXT_350381 [Caerostris extrusa]